MCPLSLGLLFGFQFIGCLDPDQRTMVRKCVECGYTREDLYKEGYTKYQLDCVEEDEGIVIPLSDSEEEEKKS
jgi:hypothetical protein